METLKTLSMMFQKPQYMNLSVVGSPTINNGIVSGFDSRNYLANTGISNFNSIELVVHIATAPTTILQNASIVNFQGDIDAHLYVKDNDKINFNFKNSGATRIYVSGNRVVTNGDYFKIVLLSTGVELYFSTDGTNWTLDKTSSDTPANSFTTMKWGYYSSTYYNYDGSIDLNNSYIKINNTKYKFQFAIPLKKVGNPTIVDGIVSGFSNSNYITASKNVSLSSDDVLEVVLDLKMTSFASNGLCFLSNNNNIRFQFYGTSDTYKQFNVGEQSTYGTKEFLLNTYYQIKIVMTATTINMYYYENGAWILDKTYTGTYNDISALCYGDRYNHASGNYFSGEINFNNSYIITNGTKYIYVLP